MKMVSLSEKLLIRRLQRGDAAAFPAFVDQYGASVHALCRRYARTEADAEDLTQEIFVELSRSIPTFRGEASLSTWVYRVALNRCLKHQERRRPDTLPLLEEGVLADETHDPVRRAAQSELKEQVDAALSTLSDGHREVVLLHELHGLTYAECAAILEIPVGTVKSRLFHAFGRLRTRLATYIQSEEEITPAGSVVSASTGTLTETTL